MHKIDNGDEGNTIDGSVERSKSSEEVRTLGSGSHH
jgi:hypothetical protein